MTLEAPNEGMTTEKLYSPLFVKIVEDDYREQYSGDYWSDPLSQMQAVRYEFDIHQAILRERRPEEEPRGLMTYYSYHDNGGSIDEKVHALHVDVEERRDRLWCVATLELKEELTPEELAELKDYLSGQYSDGFGEGFEQHEIAVDDGELYVSLWESGDVFFIDTEREFMQRLGLEAPAVVEEKPSVLSQLREARDASKEPRGDDPSRGRGGPDL